MYWDRTVTWFKRSGMAALCCLAIGGTIAGMARVLRDPEDVCGNAAVHMQRGSETPVCVASADVLNAMKAGYERFYVTHPVSDFVCATVLVVSSTIVQVCLVITLWFLFLHMVWQFFNAVRGNTTYWGTKEEAETADPFTTIEE
jgi:TM2 domain-containing membrane protein YozV